MKVMRNAEQIVEQEFLQVRAKILEIAAFFDRLETGRQAAGDSPNTRDTSSTAVITRANQERLELLRAGCQLLLTDETDKAAGIQLLFSRKFDEQWRKTLDVK